MIGRYLEAKAKKKTSDSIRELIGLQPTVTTLVEVEGGKEILQKKKFKLLKFQLKINF